MDYPKVVCANYKACHNSWSIIYIPSIQCSLSLLCHSTVTKITIILSGICVNLHRKKTLQIRKFLFLRRVQYSDLTNQSIALFIFKKFYSIFTWISNDIWVSIFCIHLISCMHWTLFCSFTGDDNDQSMMCHCYSDLHPFHCEEEEGVDLLPVNCIEHKKVPNSRPLLTMLSRSASTLKPKASKHSGVVSKTQYHKGL